MDNPRTNEVLCSILEMLKTAGDSSEPPASPDGRSRLADAVGTDHIVGARLRAHPFYDQGRAQLESTGVTIQNIDALIRQLRKPR